ncbi:zinc finger protein Xfin [Toxorhynchites rutilus septentrionalis]|uniref:zinc finger protein Xfin n=1 Tax=Toxorhynchites rutilus septentrionalis TaxID=329112 RepID=UPI0024790C2A|nr:zinc finger protein Xfin [Toxorhynchites rutilus septentrionalis]
MADKGIAEDLRCRVCLESEVNELISMFCVGSTQNMLLSHMALACTGVLISTRDELPKQVCDTCFSKLDLAYSFWRRCRQSWGEYRKLPDTTQNEDEDLRCRICLSHEVEELVSLYCICDSQLIKINEMINEFAGLAIEEKDGFPQYICDDCLAQLDAGFAFRKRCRNSNTLLRKQAREKSTQLNGVSTVKVLFPSTISVDKVPGTIGTNNNSLARNTPSGAKKQLRVPKPVTVNNRIQDIRHAPDATSSKLSPRPKSSKKNNKEQSTIRLTSDSSGSLLSKRQGKINHPEVFDQVIDSIMGEECGPGTMKNGSMRSIDNKIILKKTPTAASFDVLVEVNDTDSENHSCETDSDDENAAISLVGNANDYSRVDSTPRDPIVLTADNENIFDLSKETQHYKILRLKGELCCGCQRLYDSPAELRMHCVEYHPVGMIWKHNRCCYCQETYKTKAALTRHCLQRAKKLYYCCKICRNLLLENEDDFAAHRSARHSRLQLPSHPLDGNMLLELESVSFICNDDFLRLLGFVVRVGEIHSDLHKCKRIGDLTQNEKTSNFETKQIDVSSFITSKPHQEVFRMRRICCVCRKSGPKISISIYCMISTHQKTIAGMLEIVGGIKLNDSDRLPDQICDQCSKILDDGYSLWKRCRVHHLISKCIEGQEDQYLRCRICTQQDVSELISLHSVCDTWKMKVHEMVRYISGVAINKKAIGLPPYVCDVCLDVLDKSVRFKKLCLETNEILRSETSYAWEKMAFETSDRDSLVVDLFAEIVHNVDTGKLKCSICKNDVTSSSQLSSCDGCLLKFQNITEINNIENEKDNIIQTEDDVIETEGNVIETEDNEANIDSKTAQFFDLLEDASDGLFLKIRRKGPVCCGCNKIFLSENDLHEHRLEVHPPIDVKNQYYCEFCRRNLESKTQLENHHRNMRSDIFMYCKICRKIQTDPKRHKKLSHISEETLKKFRKQITTIYECCITHCDSTYDTQNLLLKHFAETHSRNDLAESNTCGYCDRKFSSKNAFLEHNTHAVMKEKFFCQIDECTYTDNDLHGIIMHCSDQPHNAMLTSTNKRVKPTPNMENLTTIGDIDGIIDILDSKGNFCCGCLHFFKTTPEFVAHCEANHSTATGEFSCKTCKKAFSTKNTLRMHERKGAENMFYYCRPCKLFFWDILEMNRHKAFVHTDIEPETMDDRYERVAESALICCGCDKHFKYEAELIEHRLIKHSRFITKFARQCPVCVKIFESPELLQRHMDMADSNMVYKCKAAEDCTFRCKQLSTIKLHVTFKSHQTVKGYVYLRDVKITQHGCCFIHCDFVADSYDEIVTHANTNHNVEREKNRALPDCLEKILCPVCYKIMGSKISLMRHQRTGLDITCRFCMKTFKREEYFTHAEACRIKTPKQHICCILHCDFVADTYDELIKHADIDHVAVREKNTILPNRYETMLCPVCHKGKPDEYSLFRHQRARRFTRCKICGKKIKREEYSAHIEGCQTTSKAKCGECTSDSPCSIHSKTHRKTKYEKRQLVSGGSTVCSICGKFYKTQAMLRDHMIIHQNKRIYRCNLCPLTFNSYLILKNHGRVHTKEKKFKCRQGCEKMFKCPSDRSRHEKSVHLGIKPFGCTICSASFVRDRDLRLHMRKHTGLKLFPCDNCGASFDVMSEFKQHKGKCVTTKGSQSIVVENASE